MSADPPRDAPAPGDGDVPALAEAMRRAGVRVLDVEEPGRRLRIELAPSGVVAPAPVPAAAREPPALVKAAAMGHFRAAHPDGLFPACVAGDAVARAQVLGFVQVRLLLLPVAAPRAGRLARVLAAEGDLVGYGTPLFELGDDAPG